MPQRSSLGKRLGAKGGARFFFFISLQTLCSYSADRIKQYKHWDAGNFCQKSKFLKWKQACLLLEVGSHFGSLLQNLTSSNPKREILWLVCLTFSGVDWNPLSLCLTHPLTSFLPFLSFFLSLFLPSSFPSPPSFFLSFLSLSLSLHIHNIFKKRSQQSLATWIQYGNAELTALIVTQGRMRQTYICRSA